MFLTIRRLGSIIGLLMLTVNAASQTHHESSDPFVTDLLDITLQGAPGCTDVRNVLVVMSGEENQAFSARRDPRDHCHWTATRPTGSFDTSLEHFSLRLGSGRTTCKPAKGDVDKGVARVAFLVYKMDVRVVTITTSPVIPNSYIRGVPAHSADRPSIPCAEGAFLTGEPIPDVWFSNNALHPNLRGRQYDRYDLTLPAEKFRLQFGRVKPDPHYPGLILNDEALTRHLKGNEGSVAIQEIIDAFDEERAKAKLSTPPLFSPNAYEADRQTLVDLATDKLVLNVFLVMK